MEDTFITNCLLLLGVLCGPVLIFLLGIWFAINAVLNLKRRLVRIYQLRSVPCGHCLYYTGQAELSCAVQPCLALTKAAHDCRDFERTAPHSPPNLEFYKSQCRD
ncbi:MAG: hypothetical protein AAFU71_16130 [Cyanobacteria bacterium J06632_22]